MTEAPPEEVSPRRFSAVRPESLSVIPKEASPRRFSASRGEEASPRRFSISGDGEASPRRYSASRVGEAGPRRFSLSRDGEASPRRFSVSRDGEASPRRFSSSRTAPLPASPKDPPPRRYSATRSELLPAPPINHSCLQEHPFFKERDPKLLELLLENLTIQVFLPGVTVFKEGDKGDCMYFLYRGEVEVLLGPEERQVAKLGDGSLFGEMALLGHGKRAATVRALDVCDCRSIDASAFKACLQRFPAERTYFLKLTATRMEALDTVNPDWKHTIEKMTSQDPSPTASRKWQVKPIDKFRRSGLKVRDIVRKKLKDKERFSSGGGMSDVSSASQEEDLGSPCCRSSATEPGVIEDVSDVSGNAESKKCPPMAKMVSSSPEDDVASPSTSSATKPGLTEGASESYSSISPQNLLACELPTTPKPQSPSSPHKRKFISSMLVDACGQDSNSCCGQDNASGGVDCLLDDKGRFTCSSQSTACVSDDMRITDTSDRVSWSGSPQLQITTPRPDTAPAVQSNLGRSPEKFESGNGHEACDQGCVEKSSNVDLFFLPVVSSGKGDSFSDRPFTSDAATKSRLILNKNRGPGLVEKLSPLDATYRSARSGCRSLSYNSKSNSQITHPASRTRRRAVDTWWRFHMRNM